MKHQQAGQGTQTQRAITVARPMVGPPTIRGAWIGGLIGLVLGVAFGVALGNGRIGVPVINPMATPGPFDASVAWGGIMGSLGALLGALAGLRREPMPPRSTQAPHAAAWPHRLPVWGAWVLAVLWVVGLLHVATAGLFIGASPENAQRLHWNTKNTTRVAGPDAAATAQAANAIAYPAAGPRLLVSVPDRWEYALAATPLVALPTDGAVVVGPGNQPSVAPGGQFSLAGASSPADAAATADAERIRQVGTPSQRVVIVGMDDARYALPAVAWAARTGDAVLFASRDALPAATVQALERRNGQAEVIVLAPASLVGDQVLRSLERFGRVQRVSGTTPEAHAVRVAEAYDPVSGFGWGYGSKPGNELVERNYLVVNRDDWRSAVAGAPLVRATAKAGPLLLVHQDGISPIAENFLWRMRPRFVETPAEGPFNHAWVVGGFDQVSFKTQGNLDYTQEIEVQQLNGETAMSGYEALVIAWLAMGFASAIFIAVHSRRVLPEVMPAMRASWAMMGLLTGPIGLGLYVAAYHRQPAKDMHGMTMWQRPFWLQVATATVMTFAIDMVLMILVVVYVAWATGFPAFGTPPEIHWLGNSMMWMMILMFVGAFALMWTLFHAPMVMAEEKVGYVEALRRGLPGMGWSMVAESIGMMPVMWFLMMYFLPGMEMPSDENVWLWGTLLGGTMVGLVTAYLANIYLVRKGIKSGAM